MSNEQLQINTLKTLIKARGLKAEDLDDLIHDVASEQASRVNNEGLEAQLEFLISRIGYDDTGDEIEKLRRS